MSNDLVVQEKNPVAEIENVNKIIQSLMKLPHYQKMGMDTVFAIVAKAISLKIDPIYALNGGLYSIKGKIGMPAEAMAAMIREKGHSIQKDKNSTDTCCILHGKRRDNGDEWTCKFSVDDAKRAGIYANSWEKYTNAMVYNRAMSFLARQLFPDVIKGAGYTKEELQEIAASKNPEDLGESQCEVVVDRISLEQADELREILDQCSQEYITSFMTRLKNPPISVSCLSQLPLALWDRVLSAAIKNRDEYAKSKPLIEEKHDNNTENSPSIAGQV